MCKLKNVWFIVSVKQNKNTMTDNTTNEPNDSGQDTLNSLKETFEKVTNDAKAKAEEAAPKVKQAMASAAHDVAYGAAYGASFIGTLVSECLPQIIKEGMEKGNAAGGDAAKSAADKLRSKKSHTEAECSGAECHT